MSATENSIIPSVMEENASSSCTGQTKRNSSSTKTKEKKTVTDEAKIRHNEIERLRWHRLKEAQQKMIALLPPLLQEERKPQTQQMCRLVHYIAFLEMLVMIGRINNGHEDNGKSCRLLRLLFGADYRQELIKTNTVPVFDLQKMLIELRKKVGDVLKQGFHHPINRRMAVKSKKVVLVSNLNFESGFVSHDDNGDDHSSVDSKANEGGSHPEAA